MAGIITDSQPAVTAVAGGTAAAEWADRVTAGSLVVLAVLTSLTGARTPGV
jgi:hypothetical protein